MAVARISAGFTREMLEKMYTTWCRSRMGSAYGVYVHLVAAKVALLIDPLE